jgi:hypothetical protein
MGHCVDQEKAQSWRGPDLETEAAWQAHYIKWAEIFCIPDPCSYCKGIIRIVAIYIKYVQCSVNYYNKQVIHSATVRGYPKVVNNLFKLRRFSPPANLSNPNNMTAILLNNMLRKRILQGNVLRSTTNFLPSYVKWPQPANARIQSAVSDLLFDVVALGRFIGPRLSEYAQTTQDKVDYHTYPSGTTVIKAFIANNFVFYDDSKRIIKELN